MDAYKHKGPPLPPLLSLEILRDPAKSGYDQFERQSVKCPTERCPETIICIRKALKCD